MCTPSGPRSVDECPKRSKNFWRVNTHRGGPTHLQHRPAARGRPPPKRIAPSHPGAPAPRCPLRTPRLGRTAASTCGRPFAIPRRIITQHHRSGGEGTQGSIRRGGGRGGGSLKRGGGCGRTPPPPSVPLWSPPKGGRKILKLQSSWHRRRRSKILAVSLKHWKGRRGGGVQEGYPLLLLRCTALLIHLWGGGVSPEKEPCTRPRP